jgi:hypothetical protein
VTLAEIIDQYEAARLAPEPAPINSGAVLTPKGVAVSLVVRLEQALADLCHADRAHVRRLLTDLITDIDVTN